MSADHPQVSLRTIAAQWTWIGVTGFGGPPAHIALLRRLCVQRRGWISEQEFEDGIAATNLLPGPASTQLAIYTAWRLRGALGGLVGGACFILPGLLAIIGLSAALLGGTPQPVVQAAAAGAGAAVAPIALRAAADLFPASWRRAGRGRVRWIGYVTAGVIAAAVLDAWVAVVLLGAGLVEILARGSARPTVALPVLLPIGVGGSLVWTAFKVGSLSYGGGFVIIPLMATDAVDRHGWMTSSEFLYAVALGQITPGPVVHTVAAVGYAAAGLGGALIAAVVAFGPSFAFVLGGARHFDRLRANATVAAFLAGAGPAAIGAIAGSAIVLALALSHQWQVGVLVLALVWLVGLRRGVVSTVLGAALLGLAAGALSWPVG